MVKVYITAKDALECPELNISVSRVGKKSSLSDVLCRKIIEEFPDKSNEALEVYRGDTLSYTIKSILSWSKLTLVDSDKDGLYTEEHIPFNSKSN